MKKIVTSLGAAALTLASLTACEPTRQELGTTVGGVTGAVAGGLLGTTIGSGSGRTAAIIAGSILGGVLGAGVGNRLTQEDNLYAQRTTQQTLNTYPTGQPASWRNPQSGTYGQVVPTSDRYYDTAFQQDCRRYQQTIYVDGGTYETAVGTACRQPDGTWHIVG